MLKLSAFADEIDPGLDEQIRVLKICGVSHFELRTIEKVNVLQFSTDKVREHKQKIDDAGLGVVSIGSPVGKTRIDEAETESFDMFKIAVERAHDFGAPLVRIFSFYPPENGDINQHRDEVMRRMQAMTEYLAGSEVTLVHENEKSIFGEGGKNCLDLMRTIESPNLRTAFDFANFVQAKESPLDNWPLLKPYTRHIHIKDAMMETGKVVPAGEGDGQIEPIVKDAYESGYRGFLSLEPHLAAAGQFSGFSGPDLFTKAVNALRAVCARIDVPLEGA